MSNFDYLYGLNIIDVTLIVCPCPLRNVAVNSLFSSPLRSHNFFSDNHFAMTKSQVRHNAHSTVVVVVAVVGIHNKHIIGMYNQPKGHTYDLHDCQVFLPP